MRTPSSRALPAKVDLQMTPLIDVVFQLTAFFLMTFRVAPLEGDFQLRLPPEHRIPGTWPHATDRIEVRLAARTDGDLATVQVDRLPPIPADRLPWHALRSTVARAVRNARSAGQEDPEVVVRADDRLRYEHVLNAVASASTTYDSAGRIVPSAKRIRLEAAER